jgi:hypothetical protein
VDGSGDFRPEADQRASDPSLEDMLRRARDAHLGADLGATIGNQYMARLHRHPTPERQVAPVGWRYSVVVFVVGLLVGVLVTRGVIQAGKLMRGTPAQRQNSAPHSSAASTVVPTVPANTPLPTTTNTPVSTPTDMPTATAVPALQPPTIDEIVSVAQDFYNTLGPYAGTYVFTEATAVQIQSLDESQLTACIAFDFASVDSPDTVAGSDTRRFVLSPATDGTWQVVEMDSAASCSLN